MKKIRIVVSGMVQGVFFRHTARVKARELGVKGYVRNLANGKVEIVAGGDELALQKLIEFAREGPDGATVTGIEVEHTDEELGPFEVRY